MIKKQFYTTLLVVFLANFSMAQKMGDFIELSTYCKVLKYENIYETENSSAKYLEPYYKFIVNKIENDSVALKALNFTELEKAKIYNDKIYYISRIDFDRSAVIVEKEETISASFLSLPFKARPQNDLSFDTDFNLNTTLNWRISSIYDAHLHLQTGAGIGIVNLDASNTKGLATENAQDIAALSVFSGLMIAYKKVQAGIYVGLDYINNQSQYQWNYNGKPWIGFGVGFQLFKVSLAKNETQQKNIKKKKGALKKSSL